MNQVKGRQPAELVDEALEQAESLRDERKLDQAIELLIDSLQYNIKSAKVYFRLGNIYFDKKDYEKAEYTYRRAIDQDAAHINAHHNLSVVYRKQGRIAESIKQRKKASKIARNHPERIELSDKQVVHLRGFAKRFLLISVGVVAGVIVLFFVLSRL